jgi:hypothetical protein
MDEHPKIKLKKLQQIAMHFMKTQKDAEAKEKELAKPKRIKIDLFQFDIPQEQIEENTSNVDSKAGIRMTRCKNFFNSVSKEFEFTDKPEPEASAKHLYRVQTQPRFLSSARKDGASQKLDQSVGSSVKRQTTPTRPRVYLRHHRAFKQDNSRERSVNVTDLSGNGSKSLLIKPAASIIKSPKESSTKAKSFFQWPGSLAITTPTSKLSGNLVTPFSTKPGISIKFTTTTSNGLHEKQLGNNQKASQQPRIKITGRFLSPHPLDVPEPSALYSPGERTPYLIDCENSFKLTGASTPENSTLTSKPFYYSSPKYIQHLTDNSMS